MRDGKGRWKLDVHSKPAASGIATKKWGKNGEGWRAPERKCYTYLPFLCAATLFFCAFAAALFSRVRNVP